MRGPNLNLRPFNILNQEMQHLIHCGIWSGLLRLSVHHWGLRIRPSHLTLQRDVGGREPRQPGDGGRHGTLPSRQAQVALAPYPSCVPFIWISQPAWQSGLMTRPHKYASSKGPHNNLLLALTLLPISTAGHDRLNFTTSMEIRAWVRFYCEAERQHLQARTTFPHQRTSSRLPLNSHHFL